MRCIELVSMVWYCVYWNMVYFFGCSYDGNCGLDGRFFFFGFVGFSGEDFFIICVFYFVEVVKEGVFIVFLVFL